MLRIQHYALILLEMKSKTVRCHIHRTEYNGRLLLIEKCQNSNNLLALLPNWQEFSHSEAVNLHCKAAIVAWKMMNVSCIAVQSVFWQDNLVLLSSSIVNHEEDVSSMEPQKGWKVTSNFIKGTTDHGKICFVCI
jgi:hypothetical protein